MGQLTLKRGNLVDVVQANTDAVKVEQTNGIVRVEYADGHVQKVLSNGVMLGTANWRRFVHARTKPREQFQKFFNY